MVNHMRVALFVALFLLGCLLVLHSPAFAHGQQANGTALTNDDVVKMVGAKLPDDVIVAKIKSSSCKFDTSADALIKLQQAGVSSAVLAAMAASGAPSASAPPVTADPNDPLSPHSPGIYWLSKGQGGNKLTRLAVSSYGGSKSSGVLGAGMSMGFKKAKWKATLAGAHAALRIPDASPEFWFYFADSGQAFGQSGLSAQASKPDDFALARMEVHKGERQLVVGQASVLGNSSGLRPQDLVPVDIQKVSEGKYKVTVKKPLPPGEYSFVPPGSAAAFGMAGGQLFDFGVDQK